MSEHCSTEIDVLTARCAELEAKLAAAESNTDLLRTGRDPAAEARIAASAANGRLRHRVEDQTPAFQRRTFTEIFLNHSGYLSDKWAQFLPVYDFELESMIARGRPLRLLEIGVQNGGSLQIWHEYLPEGSQIYGLDIDQRCRRLAFPPQVKVLIGDAGNPTTLNELLGDEVFDVIIDDGSHQSRDVIASIEALLPRLTRGGKYFIEDLHTSYWPSYGGGFRRAGSAIEHVKNFIDALHTDYLQATDAIEEDERHALTDLNAQIGRVSFYDSLAVIVTYSRPKITPFSRVLSGREIGVTGASYVLDAIIAGPNEFTLCGGATDVVVSAAARKVSDLRKEAHRQRADIEQRAATEAALRAEIVQRAATEAALRAEIEQRVATEATLRADIEQRAATEAALRAEIEQRAATEAALQAEIEQRAVAAEALQTELKILRSKLAVAERAAGSAEVLQGDIASLQTQLDVAERELRERNTKAEALQGEITTSRIQLAAAERDARERAAAAEVMQREITSLRGELAAARDVGRATLASLRTPSAPILEAPRNAGWLTVVLRGLGLRSSYPLPVSPVIADG